MCLRVGMATLAFRLDPSRLCTAPYSKFPTVGIVRRMTWSLWGTAFGHSIPIEPSGDRLWLGGVKFIS